MGASPHRSRVLKQLLPRFPGDRSERDARAKESRDRCVRARAAKAEYQGQLRLFVSDQFRGCRTRCPPGPALRLIRFRPRVDILNTGSVRSAKAGWPADANQRFVRIGKAEFVHSPGLVLRCALPKNFISEFGCQSVHVLEVKIETERVQADLLRDATLLQSRHQPTGTAAHCRTAILLKITQ
jgi:hypothetical protein